MLTATGDLADSLVESDGSGNITANVTGNLTGNVAATTITIGGASVVDNRVIAHQGCLVNMSADLSVASLTYTYVGFNTEQYDDASIHDTVTNNNRLTVPSGVTKVRLTANAAWLTDFSGEFIFGISKNDETTTPTFTIGLPYVQDQVATGTSDWHNMTSAVIEVTAGDWFTLFVYQSTGGAEDLDSARTWFAMEIIE